MDTEELTVKQENGREEDPYSIARFVEKHWVALIGILTAGVAIISAVVDFMAYMFQYLYLKQWNVNDWFLAKAELGPAHFYVLTAFCYCVSVIFIELIMSRRFAEYYTSEDRLGYYYLRAGWEKLRKANRELRKDWDVFRKRRDVEENERIRLSEAVTKCRENEKIIGKEIRGHALRCIKTVGGDVLWIFVSLLVPSVLISMITQSFTLLHVVVEWILLSVVVTLMLVANVHGRHKEYRAKTLRKRARENCDQAGGCSKQAFDAFLRQYPDRRKWEDQPGSVVSIWGIISCLVGGLAAMFVFVLVMAPGDRELHWTYEDGGTTYAVVYHVDDMYVLEQTQLSEDGKTVLVDTARQRILSGDDITIEYVDAPMKKLEDR